MLTTVVTFAVAGVNKATSEDKRFLSASLITPDCTSSSAKVEANEDAKELYGVVHIVLIAESMMDSTLDVSE